jgi:hypothetical protein
VNSKGDSVLTAKRQAELAEVAQALAAFKPTVVVTERETAPPEYVDPKFAEFNSEMLAGNDNERVQIAYRLASVAGVKRVYGIDEQPSDGEPDYFPFAKIQQHAATTDQEDRLQALFEEAQKTVAAEMGSFRSMTIADALIQVNAGPLSSADLYYRLLDLDQGEDQPGAELNAYWFMRNAKIFSKLIDVAHPGDRVVIVYGAGHKFWLEHLVDNTPGFEKVDPVPWLEKAAR